MKSSAKKIELASVDDLFSTEEGRQDAKLEKIQEIPLSELHPFRNHPFKVKDDEAMMETADSIKQYGVLVPAIARPDPEGGYELVAGHRRHRASELAGKETMPVIVRDLDDDAATIIMVDSNLQRESLLPSERALVRQYNEEMNSTRPREYDGSHITFGGMNPAITLREHQKSAIAHVLYGGNTLLAHEVGAGKTFEMVAAAMEAKRLGLCQKSLFVVPNHLTEQWASEFLRLYPSANILVTTKKDFETHNRKKFCARIATGDYDAIIMGHSQFERIPISRERQERLLYEQIDEITEGIAEVQASGGERFTVKQLERTRKSLEARLEKLQAEGRKDDVVTFEQLGVDRLFVDEAHNYKNLFLYTKMRNVAGLSTSDAQKSSDMLEKFGAERVQFILANTIQHKNHDGRISQDNKAWAKTIPMPEDSGASRHCAYLVVDGVNPGLTDLFTRQARKTMQEQQKSSVLQKLKQEPPAHKPAAPKKQEPER